MTVSRSVVLSLVLTGVVVLGGCGGDGANGPAEVAAPSPTATVETTEAVTPEPTDAAVVDPTSTPVPTVTSATPTFDLVIPTPTPAVEAPTNAATAEPTTEPTAEVTPPPTDPPLPADEDEQEGTGEPVFEFDEAAALVCANAEYALDAADAGDDAGYATVTADMATWAAETSATELVALAQVVIEAPAAADGRDAVITLLEACADAGYQL